tara:strand:- start:18 stop:536 length:519 start_codon:yes stop_codon:yes gene_type:complete
MMTLADVRKYAPENKIGKGGYSKRKNAVAWELVNLGTMDRATRIEKYIAEQIEEKTGYSAHVTNPTCSWDITVDLEDYPVKIEVKSAMQQKGCEGNYNILNVKYYFFDYLFIVLVTPEGVRIGWAYTKDIKRMCLYRTEHSNGYAFSLNTRKWDRGEYKDWLFDIDDFPYEP